MQMKHHCVICWAMQLVSYISKKIYDLGSLTIELRVTLQAL